MKISRKGEYACLALVYLARNYNDDPVKMIDIANNNNIPKKYLEQILLQLKGAGFVRSIRGKDGGYALARHPKDINLAQIIRLLDGPLASVQSVSQYYYEQTPIEQNQKLWKLFKDIRDYVSDKMEKTTLEDLI